MTAWNVLPAVCFSLVLSGAMAQTTETAQSTTPVADQPKPAASEPEKKPPVRETPPDVKAFNDLNKITDPEKKIAAIEKWKADFSTSSMLEVADDRILSTLVQKLPGQKVRIRTAAGVQYRKAAPKNRGAAATRIADQFLDADLLLKDAERYARKGVESMLLAAYLQDQIASYEKRKAKPPSSEELQKRFQESRAARVATLGRIEVKLGQTRKGQKLLEESYAVNPSNVNVDAALGELAVKAGNDAKAVEYLIPARLSGRAPKGANEALESIYRKTHAGSPEQVKAGLEAMLDTEYRKRYPNPVTVEAYKPTEKRSDRLVLGEVFTGSGCPPCAGADIAFDAAMERYSRKDLAVVMYHEHVPRPDPMTNVDTQARSKSYSVTGVPTFAIDGKKTMGGGSRDMAKQVFDRFQKDLEKDLETPAEAQLKADATLSGNAVKVRASVEGIESDSKDLKVQIVLVEKELRFNGENGIRFHPMVVRAMGGTKGEGFAVDAAASAPYEQTFDLDEVSKAIKAHLDDYEGKGHRGETFTFAEKKYQINRADLAVVVFVQDDKTKHVLQAAYVDLSPESGPHPVTEANEPR
jgi:thiol-disulfide isomerase/thioredoxin